MLITSIAHYNPNVSNVIKAKSDDFVRRISTFTKDKLIATYFYGGVLRKDFDPRYDNISAFLVFEEVNTDILEIISPSVAQAYNSFGLNTMILSRADILTSSDVFPLEFASIKESQFLLYGKDVFQQVTVPLENMRVSCELELKGYLFKLRSYLTLNIKKPSNLIKHISQDFSNFMDTLNTCIFLKTGKFEYNIQKIIETSSHEFKLDRKVLFEIRDIQIGRKVITDMIDMLQLYNKYLNIITKTARVIDEFGIYRF